MKVYKSLVFIAAILFTITVFEPSFSQQTDKEVLWSPSSSLTYAMCHYYKAEQDVVTTLGKLLDNDDDVSVCLYLSQKSGIHPQDIMGMKRQGLPWKQIIKSLNVSPEEIFTESGMYEIFGVPAKFKHSYGELKKWQKDPNHSMDLTDDDVRDLVQLRFVVVNFGAPCINVMRSRNSGRTWTELILSQGR